MSAIITATDFTHVANNAVHYACAMAEELNAPLVLTHAYNAPVAPIHEAPMPVVSLEESKSIAQEQLDKLAEELFAKYPKAGISLKLYYGDITDNLKECIKEHNADMVVVGNSSTDESNFWLGGNLLSTLRNLECPVVAVPEDYAYKKVNKIAFACDFEKVAEHLPAEQLVGLVAKTQAGLHVLNVDHENNAFDPDTPYEYAQLHEMIKDGHPEYHNIDNKDVEEGINSFVSENNMDWLVVVPHRHNFFESLFHKSQTKAIVRNAEIPIVALHEKG